MDPTEAKVWSAYLQHSSSAWILGGFWVLAGCAQGGRDRLLRSFGRALYRWRLWMGNNRKRKQRGALQRHRRLLVVRRTLASARFQVPYTMVCHKKVLHVAWLESKCWNRSQWAWHFCFHPASHFQALYLDARCTLHANTPEPISVTQIFSLRELLLTYD